MSAVLDYRRKLHAIRDLPTLPVIAQKVLRVADDDESGPEKLAEIISSDQSLAVKILSLANSAYYGHRAQIGTIRQAVAVIGLNMLKQLSLSVLVCGSGGRGWKDRTEFWKHSFGTATASYLISRRLGIPNSDLCFMSGLLHDVGRLIIATYFPEDEGVDHTEVGAWMAYRWQLPKELAEAIAFHHSLEPHHLSLPMVACVHAANVCARRALAENAEEVSSEVLAVLKLTRSGFEETVTELRNQSAQIDRLLL